ncbi:MAG: DUF1801 domain-containing protein [Nannocystales bacterium]
MAWTNTVSSIANPDVRAKFETYPPAMQTKLLRLRRLIVESAREHGVLGTLQETLKWNEPSYLAKGGSAVRFDYKPAMPDRYALYFQCQTKLIATFREVHRDAFEFEGNRAIVLKRSAKVLVRPLKHCIGLALRYHSIKHLPLLGA